MGGTAYQIWGKLDNRCLQPQSVPTGFLGKILGRKKKLEIKTTEWKGHKNFEVPIGDLKKLPNEFWTYLNKTIQTPSPATKYVLDYFKYSMKIYVRGEQAKDKTTPSWYIQLSFSGCAGMAEVSAELGFHWVDIWYQKNKKLIDQEILLPYGFIPDKQQPQEFIEKVLFLPLGQVGYAKYHEEQNDYPGSEEVEGSKLFELDESISEYMDDQGCLRELDDLFGTKMAEGQCCCQLCDPGFDLSVLEKLSFGN